MNNEIDMKNSVVLGQKYGYATISLILGIFCFVNFLGLEKAILAVIFGWLALREKPLPKLNQHRLWAQVGIAFGVLSLIIVPTIIILNFDRLHVFIEALQKMSSGR